MSTLEIPKLCLVVLVGASGSGKSTFAREHFGAYETLSSDRLRGIVANDETDQSATADAFDALGYLVGKRLERGLLTVVDATSVQPAARKYLVDLAKAHDVLPVAIVFDVGDRICLERNAARADRSVPDGAVKRQNSELRRGLKRLGKEGFRKVHVLHTPEDVAQATIVRVPSLNDRSDDHGPFDVIGDVHGCLDELVALLGELGYALVRDGAGRAVDAVHPEGRRAIFLGDLVDRGPNVVGVLRLAMGMVEAGHALAVPGNHENKLVRALKGAKVTVSHGLAETLAELAAETPEFRDAVREFCYGLVSYLMLDDGRLAVAHAGMKEQYQWRSSARVRNFALYGETTGESDEYGLPVRYQWARDYRGEARVLYGHTPVPAVEWVNKTACLDTGCVFGGALSAMRYPELEVVSVPAGKVYCEPIRPLAPAAADREPGVLNLSDVAGKLVIETAAQGRITVPAEQSAGGLETISRWAVDPRWLIYLPPTMSPAQASRRSGYLEHPDEAFAYFRGAGVTDLIAEEKHMGSRASVLVTRDPGRFGAPDGWRGIVHTRTGRPLFDPETQDRRLAAFDAALERAGLWDEIGADWMLFDGELLPWSYKAGDLIRDMYAAVAAAGETATDAAAEVLARAAQRGLDVAGPAAVARTAHTDVRRFREAYRRYLGGQVQFAPFQLLAAGTQTYQTRDHGWHLAVADRLVAADPAAIRPTRRIRIDVNDEASVAAAVAWWQELTDAGGEGMVVKPFANFTRTDKGLVQPGIKVRGREYLRLIYGPGYTDPERLAQLRDRNTGAKRARAQREYALGLEALRRFTAGEPLFRVHEAVFGVLALESAPMDPRL